MESFEEVAREVKRRCTSDVSLQRVKEILEKAIDGDIDEVIMFFEPGEGENSYIPEESQQSTNKTLNRLALLVDLRVGDIQKQYREHCEFTVEQDGVEYGFDADGNQI